MAMDMALILLPSLPLNPLRRAENEVVFVGDGIADLAAKLIFFVGLALGNIFHLRRVPAVKLGLAFGVQGLVINDLCFAKGFLKSGR